MPNFDGTIDNRWRPDFESSQRRVREEESEPVIQSRELSFVPTRRRRFEAYDAQTAALIRRAQELERLPHGEKISKLLQEWDWLDKMRAPEEKQLFLEPVIEAVRRDPHSNEDLLVFLMLVCEPLRRSVSREFLRARSGLEPRQRDVNWRNRAEARMIHQIEREQLYDVTREAALEALFRYPSPPPQKFFPWLREAIAHRALDKLHADLPEIETLPASTAEAEAMQEALHGFERVEPPTLSNREGLRIWRSKIALRDVFHVVDEFFNHDAVAAACRSAVGRLPLRQQEVINGCFFEQVEVEALARRRRVSPSTIYNHKAQAQKRLRADDIFFSALHSLGCVRDRARAVQLAAAYPDGRLPDGRRIVVIDAAA